MQGRKYFRDEFMNLFFTLCKKLNTCFLLSVLLSQAAVAAVTITGTRVVFPGAEREKIVRTTNKGELPVLVQVWVDDGSKIEDINKTKVPFTVTPPVYRMEPGRGQSVRLIYNGMTLPQDRESVFWFNLLEIPPVNEQSAENDRLELAFRTRIKVFYRPSSLKGSSSDVLESLRLSVNTSGRSIKITNPSPYYFSFEAGSIETPNGKYSLNVDMVDPKSSRDFEINSTASSVSNIKAISLRYITDYGSVKEKKFIQSGSSYILQKQ
ncbi:molecular chaperone [Klebsiella huaxiensis]|uniref:fimbrial biogenesis chaperone n=1 Tax=Klebsiella huaxiensis TaxID=2153354 RepID=UPI0034E95929